MSRVCNESRRSKMHHGVRALCALPLLAPSPDSRNQVQPVSNSARHRMRKQGERGGAELRLALSYYCTVQIQINRMADRGSSSRALQSKVLRGTTVEPGDWSLSDGRPGQTSPVSLRDQYAPSAAVLLVRRLIESRLTPRCATDCRAGNGLCARAGGVVLPLLPACALRWSAAHNRYG